MINMKKQVISMLMCLILFFALTACEINSTKVDDLNRNLCVTLDINPSIQIEVTPSNVVESVTAINDDGKSILEENNYTNKSLAYVSKNIVGDLINGGFINKLNKSTILMTFNDLQSPETDKLKIELEGALKNAGCTADIYALYIIDEDKEIKAFAEKNKISYGKAYFCSIVAESSEGGVKAQEIAAKNISEISNTVEKNKISVSDAVNKANKKVEVSQAENTTTQKNKDNGRITQSITTKPVTTKNPKTTSPTTTKKSKTTTTTTTTTKPVTAKPTVDPIEGREPTEDELEVFRLINEERKKEGLTEYIWSTELYRCAVVRSQELLEKYSFVRPDGKTWYDEVYEIYGLPAHERTAENYSRCATSSYTAASLHDTVMQSNMKKALVLSPDCTHVGLAIITGSDGNTYIAQEFYG